MAPRPAHPDSNPKGALITAIAALLILCFLPASILGWLTGPRRLVSMILVPVSHPILQLATWIAPASPRPDNAQVAHLEAERERFKTLYLQDEQKISDLVQRIAELEKGAALSEGPIRQLTVPVVMTTTASAGGAIEVRAGSNQGVEKNTIASTGGDQLVGRITDVGSRASWITLITDSRTGGKSDSSGKIDGIVLADDGTLVAEIGNLSPIRGQRILQGQVKYPTPSKVMPAVGDTVRLQDAAWPRSAQRLIIGKITDVSSLPGGRAVVKVKPTVDIERLGEVVLRISPQADAVSGGGH